MEAVACLAGVKVGISSSCTSDQVGGTRGSTSSVLEPNWLPPGFRFHPTDDELVSYYLAKKVVDSSFAVNAIAEVDLNKCEPWELPEKAKLGEKEWYFFSLRDRKYPTGMRTNRATDAGYWKATGKDRDVVSTRSPGRLVGMKKTLVFYRGRAPKGEKTNWIMHEYRLEGDSSPRANKDEWVVCRIFQKSSGGKKSFLFSDSHIQQAMANNYPYSSEDGGRGGSPPSLMDHSPNPTVTDEENGTDCETCAGTDHQVNNNDNNNISCYNCSPTAVDKFHESVTTSARPLPWMQAGRPKSEQILLHHGAGLPAAHTTDNNNNSIILNNNSPNNHHHHLGQSNMNNMKSCNFSVYDVYDTKNFNMAFRPGFNPAHPFTPSDLTSLRAASLRPKTEPGTFCEGEDEAQSSQRELVADYGSCWASADQAVTSVYNNTHSDPNCTGPSLNNLQTLQTGCTTAGAGATESSCVTDLSLPYSGENSSLFRYKYGFLDVAGPAVDTTGLEILWAY